MKYNEEQYLKELKKLYGENIKLVGRFKGLTNSVLLQNKYGVMSFNLAYQPLKFKPGIKSALNKTEYFMNQLKELHPEIANEIEPCSEYQSAKDKMIFKTKFGLISQTPDNLIHGHIPTIRVAVNRKEYFKNQLLFIYDNEYDFEINSTNRHKGRITLICKKHGKLSVDNDAIFTGCGCPICRKDWEQSNLFYLIRLYNDEESFYKLGISHKLKNGEISRFKSYKLLGFKIDIIKIIEFKESIECKEFELQMKQLIKPFLYKPLTWEYKTSSETFQSDLLNIVINKINNVEYDIVSTSSENLSSESGQSVANFDEE